MKLEILKEHLEAAVSAAARVSNKNLSLPVLGCVVIAASQERTVVRATNLDVSIEITLKAKVIEEGMVAVPAAILSQTVSTATDQKITLHTSGNTLAMTGMHGEATLKTVDVTDFPTLPYVKEGEGVSVMIPARELARALKSVSFAASSSGMRPELASVYLSLEEGVLIAAATDSFRLAEIKIPMKARVSADPVLIPARNVGDIVRLLTDTDIAELRIGENQATIVAGGNYVTSRTVDSSFPDYRAIIPKEYGSQVTALTEDVSRAFRKVSVFTDAYNQVELAVDPEQKNFSIKAQNSAVGETHEAIDAALQGDTVTMYFNIRYILDALGVITTDSLTFKIAGPGKPMVIEEQPHSGFTYLVMPMNK